MMDPFDSCNNESKEPLDCLQSCLGDLQSSNSELSTKQYKTGIDHETSRCGERLIVKTGDSPSTGRIRANVWMITNCSRP